MNNIRKFIALTTVMALCVGQIQAQEYCDTNECDSAAYCDCGRASYWSAAIPIGALIIAAIVIASTSGGGGHHHSSSDHHHHHRSSSSFDPFVPSYSSYGSYNSSSGSYNSSSSSSIFH